MKNLRKRWIN